MALKEPIEELQPQLARNELEVLQAGSGILNTRLLLSSMRAANT